MNGYEGKKEQISDTLGKGGLCSEWSNRTSDGGKKNALENIDK